MTLVEDRAGPSKPLNAIDIAALMIVLVLIPVAYAGYLLFRSPQPKLLAISPSTLHQGKQLTVEIQGRDLRPFLRVSFNDIQGRSFLIGSTKSAMVDLPDLAAGTYDVVLYDYRQEVDRLPKALTILPLAGTQFLELDVTGAFVGLPDAGAAEMKVGQRFPATGPPTAEILSVGSPVPAHLRIRAGNIPLNVPIAATELPATLRVRCTVSANPDGTLGCLVYGQEQPAAIARESALTLAGPRGWVRFQIADVRLASKPSVARALIRLAVTEAQLSRMKPGDVDRSPLISAVAATIVSLGAVRSAPRVAANSLSGAQRTVDVTMQVPVDRVLEGWTYKQEPFKIGAPFTFETDQYVVRGEVIDMTLPSAPPTPASR
jgi:hypothetical protein